MNRKEAFQSYLDASAALEDSETSYTLDEILDSCKRARKEIAEERRKRLLDEVQSALNQLDGSSESAVKLISGVDDLTPYGGM